MTVAELIELLKKYPPEMKVAYQLYSERCILEEKGISTEELCRERPDGWMQNKRPDMESELYLVSPGISPHERKHK